MVLDVYLFKYIYKFMGAGATEGGKAAHIFLFGNQY
jgi:hypothetical protein